MNKKLKAKIALLIITILWASAPSLIKIALTELQEFNLIALRFIFAFLLLLILFYKKVKLANKETYMKAFCLSMILFMVFVSMTFGIRLTTASKAGFLACLAAVFVPFFTYFAFRRRPELRIILGTVITVVGVGVLTLKSNLSINLGDLLCLISSMLYGLYISMTESYASKCEPIALSILQMGFIGVFSTFVSLITEKPHMPASGHVWISVIIMTFLCTGAAFLVQTVAQKYVKAEDAAIINTMEPLFAMAFAAILLHESMSIKEIGGGILLLSGVIVTQLNGPVVKKIINIIGEA